MKDLENPTFPFPASTPEYTVTGTLCLFAPVCLCYVQTMTHSLPLSLTHMRACAQTQTHTHTLLLCRVVTDPDKQQRYQTYFSSTGRFTLDLCIICCFRSYILYLHSSFQCLSLSAHFYKICMQNLCDTCQLSL